jgi:dipeptidyl aminopeptidase/acylaminoacyl peptidase
MTTENKILSSAIDTYRHYAGQPTLSDIESCRQDTNDEILHLTLYFATMDLVKLEDLTYTRSFTYSLKTRQLLFTSNVTLINKNIVRRLASPDGKYLALVTKETKGEQELQYVQIWHDEHLIFGYEVSDSKVSPHGKILPKNDYASFFEWNQISRQLVFTAEEKRKPMKSYFTAEKLDEIGEPASAYRENWGEQMEAFETSVVCILDLDTKQVKLIENQPKDLYFGQCTWTTNPDELIFVAYRLEPYRLGLIYCENRSSTLFKCNYRQNEWTQLTEFDQLCRLFPRHLPNEGAVPVSVRIGPFAFRSHSMISHLGPFPIRSVLIHSHFGPNIMNYSDSYFYTLV